MKKVTNGPKETALGNLCRRGMNEETEIQQAFSAWFQTAKEEEKDKFIKSIAKYDMPYDRLIIVMAAFCGYEL